MKPTRCSRRGFTLIELLVVVAVIALLIGILLPALGSARQSAQKAGSASNLRQVLIIHTLYANNYDGWYPVLPPQDRLTTRRPPDSYIWSHQHEYGGYAGCYSLLQEAEQGSGHYDRGFYYEWDPTSSTWRPPADFRSEPILAAYIENTGDYEMLQNPADRLDGNSLAPSSRDYPETQPKDMGRVEDVVWHNISYFYIAGLKLSESAILATMGDESNADDTGGGHNDNTWETLRLAAPNELDRGYQDDDNFGADGGHFSFTDGHVEWFRQKRGDTGQLEPHDEIFDDIDTFHRGGSSKVQSID